MYTLEGSNIQVTAVNHVSLRPCSLMVSFQMGTTLRSARIRKPAFPSFLFLLRASIKFLFIAVPPRAGEMS